jgi:SAM-dependent methyltransferase
VGASAKARWTIRRASDIVTDKNVRRPWLLDLFRPANLFQPYIDTCADRYPELFSFLQREITTEAGVRLLSFGCSVGDEVFSLRAYFPEATIVGIDISRGNIWECRRRRRQWGDARMDFVRGGTADRQPESYYDAVLCMAVLRHGNLGASPSDSCAHQITFEAFDRTVRALARCLKVGGYLVIEHSNFRFCDSSCADQFQVVATRTRPAEGPITPLFDRDNTRLDDQEYGEVIFRKLVSYA